MGRFLLLGLVLLIVETTMGQEVALDSTNLPLIIVDTDGGGSIPDEPKILATMKVIDNGPGNYNKPEDAPNDYNGRIGIEVRGSSSQFFDKKNYGIEMRTASNQDTSASLLGLPVEEDWVFHGPFSDKTLMRNMLAFHLASSFDTYSSRFKPFELILNGDYKGVYILMERVKRDNDRIDIARLEEDENSGEALTGGYIIKVDKFDGTNSGFGFESQYRPPMYDSAYQKIYFQFHYPRGRDITPQQAAYIEKFMNDFEDVLAGPNFSREQIGFRAFANEQSFIDLALLNEISKNVDGYRLSTFLYKDRDDNGGKLFVGPPWDYNLAFGNANYYNGGDIRNWQWNFNSLRSGDFWLNPFWWGRMRQDALHAQRMVDRWTQLRAGDWSDQKIAQFIDSVATVFEEPAKRNFERWNILNAYIWPNVFVSGSYEQHVDYMKEWVTARAEWIDQNINEILLISGIDEDFQGPGIQVYPNPAQDILNIKFQNTEITRYRLLNSLGQVMHSESFRGKETSIALDSFETGIYLLQLETGSGTFTRKILVQ